MNGESVLVYGASGHTGRFVVAELRRRGLPVILGGRSRARLADVAELHGLRRVREFEPSATQEMLDDVGVVVNCAGPFLDTSLDVARAAVAAGAHYVDVSAEQGSVVELYRELDEPSRAAGVAVVPALGFYGAAADLLVSATLGDERRADAVHLAIGLDRWWPTSGTRATGARNTRPRVVIRGGRLVPFEPAAPRPWDFPPPLGTMQVESMPFSEMITLERHLRLGEVVSLLTTSSLADLRDGATPPPDAVDGLGRSPQRFVVDARVLRADDERRALMSGRDIYAVTAPIAVEGVERLRDGRYAGAGARAPGDVFDAADMLGALAAVTPDLRVQLDVSP